jgi:hypothetical protein
MRFLTTPPIVDIFLQIIIIDGGFVRNDIVFTGQKRKEETWLIEDLPVQVTDLISSPIFQY